MSDENLIATLSLGFGLLRAPRQILFGEGQRFAAARVIAELGTRVLVCTDSRMADTSEFTTLMSTLDDAGLTVRIFSEVAAELPAESIQQCVNELDGWRPDVVVGVGGGSCLDHAKVTSVLLTHGGTPQDYIGEFRVPGPVLPVVAIPTTAGTGSEVTPVAVLTDSTRALKVGISSPHLIPYAAIVDPELTYSCPPGLTAHAAADALAHCVESFTAVQRTAHYELPSERVFVGKSLFTDQFALAGIRLIGSAIPRLVSDPSDRAARRDMMLAALYGGLALGGGGTTIAHALQYPLGALTHTPHGVGVGALLPYAMQFNLPARIAEFAQIAVALGAPQQPDDNDLAMAESAIVAVAGLLGLLKIPTDLHGMGVTEDRLDWVAEQGMTAARLIQNNPRELDMAALRAITGAAYAGDRNLLRSLT